MDSVQITARLPAELVARLDSFAAEHHWSRATAVQVLVERGMEQEGEQMEDEVIRGKWVMDGATTLPEAAAKLREFADKLDQLHGNGWKLTGPVEDDYGHLVSPASS